MVSDIEGKILAKLDLVVRLQALGLVKEFSSMKEKITFLGAVGLQPREIAELLQTTPNHVNVTLSQARRSKKVKVK
jgi:hypothetical protein